MNRQYISKAEYRPASPIARATENLLTVFDCLIEFFADTAVLAGIRVMMATLCFFAFVFVIGAVESTAITLGGGIMLSIMLFGIAFLSVYGLHSRETN